MDVTSEAEQVDEDTGAENAIDMKSIAAPLTGLLSSPEDIAKIYKLRRPTTVSKRFHPADKAAAIADGWKPVKTLKKSIVATKNKPPWRALEDTFWCLCKDMGYPVLNDNYFKVTFQRADGTASSKQIDILAKDDEAVLVVECNSRNTRGRKSLQKDIHETSHLQKAIADSVRSHFGNGYNPKILWLYVTHNIIWSEPDVERANAANIRIITENELQYFRTYISHVGSAGKYQFLAEFLEGQSIPELGGVKIPAVRGKLGGDTFYSFTISARHLLKIAFVNHHALNNPSGRPAYQRMIDKKRISGIAKFIKEGGYFPTNILVNFTDKCNFEPIAKGSENFSDLKFGHLILPNKYKSAWIIDGQHRLFGFSNLPDQYLDSPLFVVAFEKMDVLKEARMFITINHMQKSVPPNLLVSLQADLQMGSSDPDEALAALGSFLIRKLALDPTSPLNGRFETPGVAATPLQVLTVPEIQKGLKRSQLIGRVIKKVRLAGYLSGATDDDTLDRARRTINACFRHLEKAVPERWMAGRAGLVCTNPGIRAYLMLFAEVWRHQNGLQKIDPYVASPDDLAANIAEFCAPLFSWLANASEDEMVDRFARRYGEGGVKDYLFHLTDIIAATHSDFGSDEYRERKERSADERIAQAKLDVDDITKLLSRVVIETLKKQYGTDELKSGEKKFWELGISDGEIKSKAYKKQQSVKVEKRAPKEAYLDIIDFDSIVRKHNWEFFKPILHIPPEGVNPKSKEYHLDWIAEFNDIRNVAMHSSDYRKLSDEDLEFIARIKSELYERCVQAGFEPDE